MPVVTLGRVAVLCATAIIMAQAALAKNPQTVGEACGVMFEENGTSRVEAVPGYRVLDAPSPLRVPEGYDRIVGVLCDRSDFVITDYDHRVLTELGVPFYLSFGELMVVMEISNGQLRMRSVQGELSETQAQAIQVALNRNQSVLQGDAP